ncbi:hypothetical protein SAMN05444003_0490 [Cognatiyoonia sediminum]|uniref:Uncharacterized protein n=1 Tax=Cognatiyoonia sediminum TaxID=1508389 RepID=A0A1M5LUQ3_9RHOB|nr:hypothetical protein [Cognatiyoonia sediminum]SHG68834.1 hypothetical protein SAMN05444003_0490 [Cognatiyoonia sediminum]
MSAEQLTRIVTRVLTRWGMGAGMDMLSRGGKDPSEMTAEERAQAKASRQAMRNGQRGMRQARRFMKF